MLHTSVGLIKSKEENSDQESKQSFTISGQVHHMEKV